ncbi:sensor histidine kinase [Aureibacter tunicatorum]|uniref:Sensor histidine kinase YesM n=1 Tax=Aureibacter tunicatorum TaxID=866807 RepID=A0AAE4BV72_9BACT|nr:histidine kinase [Aureibacter tunicatorum]MDR6241483.1 sensor histidine kinase YesM [Aureibacter tunicatorum]
MKESAINEFLYKLAGIKTVYKHIIFWILVYMLYVTSSSSQFDNSQVLYTTYLIHVSLEIILGYSILYIIIPRFKKHQKLSKFILMSIVLLFIINAMYVTARIFYLEPSSPACYESFLSQNGHLSYLERLFYPKSILSSMPLHYLQPLLFLVALTFYDKQLKMTTMNEQKKTNELSALKHQLNPHFLFNTLNNLYMLTVAKSDRAPKVIEHLSNILDYLLYGYDDKFVELSKETKMIEDYLALEQVRYEGRVDISFENKVVNPVKIAPLILLTFIENAFKHGVSQELELATVDILIESDEKNIIFKISNSKPKNDISASKKKNIGLKNVKKQLDLLYNDNYSLEINDQNENFIVNLSLKKH